MGQLLKFKPTKTITMSLNEVIQHRQVLKYKMWCNIETGRNQGYVDYLEREIIACDILIKNYNFVTKRAA